MRICTLVVMFSIGGVGAVNITPQSDTDVRKKLTIKDAEPLVLSALSRKVKRLPGLSLDPAAPRGRYVLFDVLWDNPEGSVHVESYTVDLQTGELWRGIVCERVVNRSVVGLQAKLRRRLGITQAEVKVAIRDQTGCIP